MCTAWLNPSFFPASLLQGSSQRHGEYPPLSLPGGRVHRNWTVVGCGPPPLPGFLRRSSGAQHRLPVCPSSSHPLRVLHRGTDTLFLHGRADPASGRCVCLSAKIRDGLFFLVLFVCFDKQEENSWTASREVKNVSDCAIQGVRLHWSWAFKDIFTSSISFMIYIFFSCTELWVEQSDVKSCTVFNMKMKGFFSLSK